MESTVAVEIEILEQGRANSHAEMRSHHGGRVLSALIGALFIGIPSALVQLTPPAPWSPATGAKIGAALGTGAYLFVAWAQRTPRVEFWEGARYYEYGVPLRFAHYGLRLPLLRLLRGAPVLAGTESNSLPGRVKKLRLYAERVPQRHRFENADGSLLVHDIDVVVDDQVQPRDIPIRALVFHEGCGARLLRYFRAFW